MCILHALIEEFGEERKVINPLKTSLKILTWMGKKLFTYIFDEIAYHGKCVGSLSCSDVYIHHGRYILRQNLFGPRNLNIEDVTNWKCVPIMPNSQRYGSSFQMWCTS